RLMNSPSAATPPLWHTPAMTTCATCRKDYDESDEAAVREHTEPVYCLQSCRCVGRPSCYMCHGSFCFCISH
ncbi:hypothetical protein ACIGO7_35220, partial [Streptomyces virginiae]